MPNSLTFGVNLLPSIDKSDNGGLSLGNASYKWNIFGDLTGTATAFATAPKVKVSLSTTYGTGVGQNETTLNANNGEQTLAVTGTLPVKHGGTGQESLTSGYALIGNGTNAINFRQIINNESATAITADTTNDSLVTVNTIYYGLPTINNAHNYTSATTIYAPSTGGTANYPLVSKGATTTPDWYMGFTLTGDGTISSPFNAAFSNTVQIAGDTTIGADGASSNLTVWSATDLKTTLLVGGNATIDGNVIPATTNTYSLGTGGTTSPKRWSALYIGAEDTYGDPYLPVYWHNGVPTSLDGVIQYKAFTIYPNTTSITLESTAYNPNTYVLQIVITNGEANLNGAITWTSQWKTGSSNTIGEVVLTTAQTSGAVQGYIITARGCEALDPPSS